MAKTARECRYLIRFEATASDIRQMRKKLEDMGGSTLKARIQKIDSGLSRADRLVLAIQDAQDAVSEIESLKEEIEAWKDGLPENLQQGQKASDLEECFDALTSICEQLDSAITEGEQVSFPGMY